MQRCPFTFLKRIYPESIFRNGIQKFGAYMAKQYTTKSNIKPFHVYTTPTEFH